MPFVSRNGDHATPICRCRVLYLGSSVPHVTKDGLQGIQEPLRELYPEQGAQGARGIDSWLSVWSNGLLLENVDENRKKVTRFFPIDSLHYCAAVRYVLVPEKVSTSSAAPTNGPSSGSHGPGNTQPRFLPLDSPFARSPNPNHPPLFAGILRRTTGIKVLECHAFICKREMAANALVRCCFHAYADYSYAKQMENGGGGAGPHHAQTNGTTNGAAHHHTPAGHIYGTLMSGGSGSHPSQQSSSASSNSIEKVEGWRRTQPPTNGVAHGGSTLTLSSAVGGENGAANLTLLSASADDLSSGGGGDGSIIYATGDENHKVWTGGSRGDDLDGVGVDAKEALYAEYGSTMKSTKSSRPRQIMNAPAPPPPPPPVPLTQHHKDDKSSSSSSGGGGKKSAKERARRKKFSSSDGGGGSGSRDDLASVGYYMNGGGSGAGTMVRQNGHHGYMKSSSSVSGGTMLRGGYYGPPPPNGTMVRSVSHMNGLHHMPPPMVGAHHPPPMMMVSTTLPRPPSRRISTGSYKPSKQYHHPNVGGHGQPVLVPVPMPMALPRQHMMPPGGGPPPMLPPQPVFVQTGRKISKHQQPPLHFPQQMPPTVVMEEPIYMPSNRPMSPVASYQPGHFPHDAYRMQQYATMEKNHAVLAAAATTKKKKKHKNKSNGAKEAGHPPMIMTNGHGHHMANGKSPSPPIAPPRTNGAEVVVHHDAVSEDDMDEGDSIYNTGIYKRKGHLNERAFSYSIRQEHRSRSYGSLANLKFAPAPAGVPVANGVNKEELKKEREIMQMMQDLDLSGDDLERSEVPAALYHMNKSKANKVRR